MLRGVVIWYQPSEYKALIWCEDSGSLAFATGPMSWRNPMVEISVGDCVGFIADSHGRERKCRDVHLIAPQVAPELPLAILGESVEMHSDPVPQKKKPVLSLCAESPHGVSVERTGNPLLHICASRD